MRGARISMMRHNLEAIPQHDLPRSYSVRWYRTGDKEAWLRIHALAERNVPTSSQIYDEQFRAESDMLERRQAFLLDATEREVGTASVWFNDDYHGQRFGRVHWVATVPDICASDSSPTLGMSRRGGCGTSAWRKAKNSTPNQNPANNRSRERGRSRRVACSASLRRASPGLFLPQLFKVVGA